MRERSLSGTPVDDDGLRAAGPDSGTSAPRSTAGQLPATPQQLRVRALQYLTRRDYSRAELHDRLAPLAACEDDLLTVLDALQVERLLSDHRYASQRVAARGNRYGNLRLRQELKQKGVAEADIAAALPEAGDELARCRAIWEKKFGCPPSTAEARAKQMRFLQYRGFSADAIKQTLRGAEDE